MTTYDVFQYDGPGVINEHATESGIYLERAAKIIGVHPKTLKEAVQENGFAGHVDHSGSRVIVISTDDGYPFNQKALDFLGIEVLAEDEG